MGRLIVTAVAVAVVSWIALGVAAGYVGLSHSVTRGPATLLTERPIVVLLVLLASLVTAGLVTGRHDARAADAVAVALGVLALDFIVAITIAPSAIGELGVHDAPLVTLVLAVLAFQPLGALLGVSVGARIIKRLDERQRASSG